MFNQINLQEGRMKNLKSAIVLLLIWISFIFAQDKIQGSYTYTYGDKESLVEARQTCKDLAVRDAIESYYVFIQSSTGVENFQTKEDIIQSIAAGYLKDLNIVEQKEEGRTITMVVEATVMPDEVERLVQELANRDKSQNETSDTVSVTQDVQMTSENYPFAEALIRYQNQLESVDSAWESSNREQIAASVQKAQSYLEAHQPLQDGFWAAVYRCETMRMNIILDLLHADHFEKQGRKNLAKKNMAEARKKAIALKIGVNKLKSVSQLTEKQKSVRNATITRCNRIMDRVKSTSTGIRRR